MTEEQFEAICVGIEDGESLRAGLKAQRVSSRTFFEKLESDEPSAKRYTRAKDRQAEMLADEIVEISDASGFDAKIVDGMVVIDGEAVQRARLRVDSRKWVASKLLPKKYGDRQTISLENADSDTLIEALKKVKE